MRAGETKRLHRREAERQSLEKNGRSVSEDAPLQNGLSKRSGAGRTSIQFFDGRNVLLAETEGATRGKVFRDEAERVTRTDRFGRGERSRERFAAAISIAAAARLILLRRLMAGAMGVLRGRRRRLRQKARDDAMIRRCQPRRDGEERERRARGAGDRRLLHR